MKMLQPQGPESELKDQHEALGNWDEHFSLFSDFLVNKQLIDIF